MNWSNEILKKLYSIIALHECAVSGNTPALKSVLSLRFFQGAQRDCERIIQSVPTASCLQYRPSLVRDTRPWKSPLNAWKQRHSSTIRATPGWGQPDLTKGTSAEVRNQWLLLFPALALPKNVLSEPSPHSTELQDYQWRERSIEQECGLSAQQSELWAKRNSTASPGYRAWFPTKSEAAWSSRAVLRPPKHTSTCQVTALLQKVDR